MRTIADPWPHDQVAPRACRAHGTQSRAQVVHGAAPDQEESAASDYARAVHELARWLDRSEPSSSQR